MILVDAITEDFLKISFNFCQTYVDIMKTLKNKVNGVRYNYTQKFWYFPKDKVDILEKLSGGRLVWITPKWKIYGLEKPNYTELYEVKDNILPQLKNLTLFNYQKFCINFMIDRLQKYGFVINCSSVGLGKSIMSIVTQEWMKKNKGIKKTILICPKMLKLQWKEEVYDTFTDENIFLVKTNLVKQKRDEIYKDFAKAESGTLILNFHLFLFDKAILKTLPIDYVVIDEAQDIATQGGRINLSIKSVIKKIPYITILTATPIKSKPDNLYAIFQLKNNKILGDWDTFKKRHIDYEINRYGTRKIGYKNLSEIKDLVDDYTIRLTEHEVDLELPKVIPKIYKIEPDKLQKRMFIEAEQNQKNANNIYCKAKFDPKISVEKKEMLYGRVMLHAMTSRAIADDPRLIHLSKSKFIRDHYGSKIPKTYNMSPKTELCLNLVDEIINNNGKVIIYTEFERQVKLLKQDLEKNLKINVLSVTGKTDNDDDAETIKLFKNNQSYKVLIGTSALQVGHNLQVTNFVIHFDLPQSQDGIRQRRGRARRVGSKHKAIIEYFLLTKDSPEMNKFQTLKMQKYMSDSMFDMDEEQQRIIKEKSN